MIRFWAGPAALVIGMGVAGAALAQGAPLKTAVDGTFAPHAFPNLQGGVQGFNVDLAQEIGRKLKREVTVDSAQFSGLLPALQAGTYDFIIAPVTVNKERAENYLFPEGYLNTDFQLVVKRDAPEIAKLDDLKGKVVTVNRGSAYDTWARGLEKEVGWTVESYGTQTDAVQAVLSGRAVANITGNTVAAWAAKQNPGLKLSYLHSTGLVWSAAVRKDRPEMRAMLETAIECMKQDGSLAKIHEKWFGYAPKPGSAAATVFPGAGVPDMPGYDPAARPAGCS
ncbi:transporter substrate-binding domain-containing protein [Salinarimonas soli]|nr:transporter substrate-binding domain-containing protein [Salinarimonas soli]